MTTRPQGRRVSRDRRVQVRLDPDGAIWLGGHAATCVEGTLTVRRAGAPPARRERPG